jgi:hypothetical protein
MPILTWNKHLVIKFAYIVHINWCALLDKLCLFFQQLVSQKCFFWVCFFINGVLFQELKDLLSFYVDQKHNFLTPTNAFRHVLA